VCCIMVLWWEECRTVDCQGRREEGDRKKCYWAGYCRQVRRTWIIQNSRSWHRSGQDGVDGKLKPVQRAEYNTRSSLCLKKNIPDIFDCNLKTNYQILIIFGTNIPATTSHQMTIWFPTSPNVCFCTTWGNHSQQNITFLSSAIWLLN